MTVVAAGTADHTPHHDQQEEDNTPVVVVSKHDKVAFFGTIFIAQWIAMRLLRLPLHDSFMVACGRRTVIYRGPLICLGHIQ